MEKDQLVYFGKGLYLTNVNEMPSLLPKLENKCYLLEWDGGRKAFFLSESQSFKLPKTVYGNKDHLDTYLKKYAKQDKNLGVLLTGLKGDGKSVDAKILALKSNQPIIVINSGFTSSEFLKFVTNPIFDNCTIFIDEFEKVYKDEDYQFVNILKWLDGASNNKNLFIFTSNSLSINKFLINRPSRLRYIKKYAGLPWEIIEQVVNDKITNEKLNVETKQELTKYPLITMDILIEILNDILDLGISCKKAIEILNCNLKLETFTTTIKIQYKKEVSHCSVKEAYYSNLLSLDNQYSSSYSVWVTHKDFIESEKDSEGDIFLNLEPLVKEHRDSIIQEVSKNKSCTKKVKYKFKSFTFDVTFSVNKSANLNNHIAEF